MKIDLRMLYAKGIINVDDDIVIPKEIYEKMNILNMNKVKVNGKVFIDYDEDICLELNLKGNFIMPCAISLEEVNVPFIANIEEKIEEKDLKDNFFLDLFDILWENIVLEIPIRVVKEGIKREDLCGEGWELKSEK